MNSDVATWFAELNEAQRLVAQDLRALIRSRAPGLREELKWGQPCYSSKSVVCYIQKARKHVSLGFGKGARIADPRRRLEGTGSQMRHVKVPLGTRGNHSDLGALIDEALALDERD